ncbi:MAG TPA: glycosyltransferase family 2 protein [Rhizomicrobium sp.]|nr:glycosyltransferase family 2 protein [Rhizomicrobium sp.]
MPGAAIVTTLRDAGALLDSFAAYHLNLGFAHLFLFFDDPADPDFSRFSRHPNVTAISHDAKLRDAWKGLPEYQTYAAFIDREVMARQVLNTALGMELARKKGLDWLLHIDADELFFLARQSLAEHFAAAQGADTIAYANFEAVPEKADIGDPFREVDLFKLPLELAAEPSEACRALLADTPQIPPARFHFYRNGKSAVRLDSALRPNGVHKFTNWNGETREAAAMDAFVLHYACCGFDAFWRKYVTLGAFADQWLDKFDIRGAIGPLHLDSRDVVAGGDREAALAFYRRRIAIEDPARVRELLRQRILTRVSRPKELLHNAGPFHREEP